MAETQLHRGSIVSSVARSYLKRTRSKLEVHKSKDFAHADASAAISINIRKSAMIAICAVEALSCRMGDSNHVPYNHVYQCCM